MKYLLSLTIALLCTMPQSMLGMNKTYNEAATKKLLAALDPKYDHALDLKQIVEAIADGANVNTLESPGSTYSTPLAVAASLKNIDIVKALIAAGANVNSTNNGPRSKSGSPRYTPLMYAVYPNFNGRASGYDSYANAEIASHYPGSIDIIKLLLNHEADINAQDALGRTALMHAVTSAQANIVELLLQHGARMDLKNKEGKTVFELKGQRRFNSRDPQTAQKRIDLDKEIQDLLMHYTKRPEFKATIKEEAGVPAGVAGIVTDYLFGEKPKETTSADASTGAAGAAGEHKKTAAKVGEDVDYLRL